MRVKLAKIVNQIMAAVNLLVMGEAFALGVRGGADPRILFEVIKASSGYSRMVDARLPEFLFEGSFQPGFKLDLMKKDVNLGLEAAKIRLSDGAVEVDANLRTSNPAVFASGDVAFPEKYTHAAMRLVQQRYLLPADAHKLVRQARQAVIPD